MTGQPLAVDKTRAAELLGVSLETFNAAVLPSIRVVRVGRRVIVPTAELAKWLDRNASLTFDEASRS